MKGQRVFLSISSYLLCSIAVLYFYSCTPTKSTIKNKLDSPVVLIGTWEGPLEIYPKDQLPASQVQMQLEVAPVDSSRYTWILQYGAGVEADIRPYELKVKDARRGLYEVDEKNGIVLEMQQFENQFISWFDVMGSELVITYTYMGDELLFEVRSMRPEQYSISGDTIIGLDTIPLVKSYRSSVYQKALLKRKK